jgi:hypothetical protein
MRLSTKKRRKIYNTGTEKLQTGRLFKRGLTTFLQYISVLVAMLNGRIKKWMGTALVGIIVLAGIVATTSFAKARFINFNRALFFDGTVESIGTDSFDVATHGTDPVHLMVDDHTLFVQGLDLASLNMGDSVHVMANREDGTLIASIVRRQSEVYGYGGVSQRVVVFDGSVISTSDDSITINNGTVDVVFRLTTDTRFVFGSLTDLKPDSKAQISGYDKNGEFVATRVIIQST